MDSVSSIARVRRCGRPATSRDTQAALSALVRRCQPPATSTTGGRCLLATRAQRLQRGGDLLAVALADQTLQVVSASGRSLAKTGSRGCSPDGPGCSVSPVAAPLRQRLFAAGLGRDRSPAPPAPRAPAASVVGRSRLGRPGRGRLATQLGGSARRSPARCPRVLPELGDVTIAGDWRGSPRGCGGASDAGSTNSVFFAFPHASPR